MASAIVLTGASRGFGRAVAVEMASRWGGHGAHFVLTARDNAGLLKTRDEMVAASPGANVSLEVLDMGELAGMKERLTQLLNQVPGGCSSIYLINNAGSLGPLQRIDRMDDPERLQEHWALNVTSVALLTSLALRKATAMGVPLTVVNVSSLAAVQPFDCWSAYCSAKAARDMFHRCVAEEATVAAQEVRVLNYAPGPLDTDMQAEIREAMPDVPLRDTFSEMHRDGKLVASEQSAHVLGQLLQTGEFENGAHVDYYDVSKL
eukprot:TRINITY_DN55790_c0_g1_i2.p1 TRINITY_DN55790_c0_g1~~TRINITY_DN55790_c0_g1_i2.p1  ORF type:complete len:262 (+),score=52.68 TRINITY_DN55790_c0_g1_i2:232-1017(+)